MKTRYRLIAVAGAVVLLIAGWLIFRARGTAGLYRVTILPSLGGDFMAANAINERGQVTGIARMKDRTHHLFLWDRQHGTQDLGEGDGLDINNAGQIAGTMFDPNGHRQAFLWEPGKGRTLLGTLGGKTSLVWAVNNHGRMVGTSETANGRDRPFLWDRAHGMQDLATLVGTEFDARTINDAGQVLTLKYTSLMKPEYFVWDPNQGMIAIGPQPSIVWLHGLNCASWTVGEVHDAHAGHRMVAWNSRTGMRDLFPLDLPVHLAALNDANQILYNERPPDRPSWIARKLLPSWVRRRPSVPHHPCYLWDPQRGKIPLDRCLPRGHGTFTATDINNKGCIVGFVASGTRVRVVLLEPLPERWSK